MFIFISFYWLGSIAETYLTPVLSKLSKFLRLSQSFAGVTLLAFANGAPDIIASASASGGEGGLEIAVGGLFGACIFGSTVVVGYCIFKSNEDIKMP